MKLCVGGTFSPLHKGHRTLLKEAFKRGDEIIIGLTTDRFANEMRDDRIAGYEDRHRELKKYVDENFKKPYKILPIDDPTGNGAVFREDMDGIVVSKETEKTAYAINREREKRGIKPLKVYVVKMVFSNSGEIIRGTLIRKGVMDREGRAVRK